MPYHPITLNISTKVSQGKYSFQFPSSISFPEKSTISLSSLAMYNSMFNIEGTARGNNRLSIIWHANTSVQHDLVINDGYYSISDLNYQLQNFCIVNNLYMENNATGEYVYFLHLETLSVQYKAILNVYALPTAAEAVVLDWSVPSAATWSLPTTATTPQLVIPSAAFGSLIGFLPGTFPPATASVFTNVISTFTPTISPVSNIILSCNLISSPYSNPSSVFSSIEIDASFGSLIKHQSGTPTPVSIAPGTYSRVTIEFFDQLFSPLRIQDDDLVIVLTVFVPDETTA